MAGLEGKGIPSVEQTLVQLAQEWDAEEGNAGYEHQAKRQRTHSDLGLQAGLGIPVSDATSPGTIWSDLDTDMPLDDKHGIPGFHLPQAASEPEQDAQAGMNGVSRCGREHAMVQSRELHSLELLDNSTACCSSVDVSVAMVQCIARDQHCGV
jgi:hypothetical protein